MECSSFATVIHYYHLGHHRTSELTQFHKSAGICEKNPLSFDESRLLVFTHDNFFGDKLCTRPRVSIVRDRKASRKLEVCTLQEAEIALALELSY